MLPKLGAAPQHLQKDSRTSKGNIHRITTKARLSLLIYYFIINYPRTVETWLPSI